MQDEEQAGAQRLLVDPMLASIEAGAHWPQPDLSGARP